MQTALVDDELWELIQPLLPRRTTRYRHPGRRRLDDRCVLNGILFVLTTGIAWQRLPRELGFGSGMTCWRRLRDWQQGRRLAAAARTAARAASPGRAARPLACRLRLRHAARTFGGSKTGPSPVDRRKAGSKHHIQLGSLGAGWVCPASVGRPSHRRSREGDLAAAEKKRHRVGP
jgi:transposase